MYVQWRELLISMINMTLAQLNPKGNITLYEETATGIADFEHSLAQVSGVSPVWTVIVIFVHVYSEAD